jgi:hypothetical protein
METTALSPVYELQLIVLGMILAKPEMLKELDHKDFCDMEIADMVLAFNQKSSTKADKRRLISGFLAMRGVDCPSSEETVADVVTKRLKLDGRFSRCVQFVSTLAKLADSGRTQDKEEFIETLLEASIRVDL